MDIEHNDVTTNTKTRDYIEKLVLLHKTWTMIEHETSEMAHLENQYSIVLIALYCRYISHLFKLKHKLAPSV